MKQIKVHLANPDCRLLTLVGLGGIGKTRLAIEAARQYLQPQLSLGETAFTDGVYFVNLTPVTVAETPVGTSSGSGSKADVLASTIATALNFSFHGPTGLMAQLLNHLRSREMLLVLDNFEHLVADAVLLTKMLQGAPRLKFLITSRERLNLLEEWVIEVDGLEFPSQEAAPTEDFTQEHRRREDSQLPSTQRQYPAGAISPLPEGRSAVSQLQNYSAVALFVQRAQQVRGSFVLSEAEAPDVVRLCRLVAGSPLALELAASWLRVLSHTEIATEIERGLDFLTTSLRNVPERHRSLQAVFDQSWHMLDSAEQAVFRKLSVFRGGFRREAAQAVAGATLMSLTGLVDKSLLRLTPSGRYQIHELLRQFAAEKLALSPAEQEMALATHCRYYADLLYRHEHQFEMERGSAILSEFRPEADNIRAGWEWAIRPDQPVATAEIFRSVRAMRLFYSAQGWYQEGLALFDQALNRLAGTAAKSSEAQPRVAYGRLLLQQAIFCQYLSRYAEAEALCGRSLDALQGTGADHEQAASLRRLGILNYIQEKPELAQASMVKSLARLDPAEHPLSYAKTELFLGMVAHEFRQYQEAERLLNKSITVLKSFGELRYRHYGLGYLASTLYALGRPAAAKQLMGECLTLEEDIGDPRSISHMFHHLPGVFDWLDEGLALEAKRVLQKSVAICRMNDDDSGLTLSLNQVGYAHCRLGEYQAAKICFREALAMGMKQPLLDVALEALVGLAALLMKQGRSSPENLARVLTSQAFVLSHPTSRQPTRDKATTLLGEVEAIGLPPEVVAAAKERGQQSTLEEMGAALLSEPLQ